jgi:hypothetical protein
VETKRQRSRETCQLEEAKTNRRACEPSLTKFPPIFIIALIKQMDCMYYVWLLYDVSSIDPRYFVFGGVSRLTMEIDITNETKRLQKD